MPGTIIDMHLHTTRGATDSSLRPEDLAREALRRGLTGVNITEHDRVWDRFALDEYRRRHRERLFIANGMEVSTDLGHILVAGVDAYVPGIHRSAELRRVVKEAGGYLIAAHPFRHYFDPARFFREGQAPLSLTPQQAARLPVFELVDAVEALNGGNNARENLFAFQVARVLGKPVIGGSDAHSTQGIGVFCTVFERQLESEEQMLAELHAGRFHAHLGLLDADLRPVTESSFDIPAETPKV
jgi:predicted metal-dependent phosphoesterase TrpH